jgi:peptide chain release factor 1
MWAIRASSTRASAFRGVFSRRLFSSHEDPPHALRVGVQHHLTSTLFAYKTSKAKLDKLHNSDNSDSTELAKLSKSLASLDRVVELNTEYQSLHQQRVDLIQMRAESDAEEIEMIDMEIETVDGQIAETAKPLTAALVQSYMQQHDDGGGADDGELPNECMLEIRPGTGGDEASMFAGDLFASYQKFCHDNQLETSVMSYTATTTSGIKEAVMEVKAGSYAELSAYSLLKYESGVHRVQRVPVNDVRIHTSACTVVVLPAPPMSFVSAIPPGDLKMDFYRASGAGGQHVNTTESAVRITHIPTGIVAAIQDERSQHKNKDKALRLIGVRVAEHYREEEMKKQGSLRDNLNVSGNRSDRIRTYNYKDDRISDHRVKETVFGCKELVDNGGVVNAFWDHMENLQREAVMESMDEIANKEGQGK